MGAIALKSHTAPPDGSVDALAHAAAGGDLSAMRQVLEAVGPRVLAVVRRVVGPGHADVEDIAQESLIALVRALPAFRGDCSAAGYAARIAVRTAVATRTQSKRREDRRRELERDGAQHAPPASETAAAARRLGALRELLAELPAGQGETLALRFVLGCSVKEIAASTDVPINTVRSRLRLAKQALRERIEDDPAMAEELEVTT
jgi:RNA polymerase sigma-70 factor (ECF subfamily)